MGVLKKIIANTKAEVFKRRQEVIATKGYEAALEDDSCWLSPATDIVGRLQEDIEYWKGEPDHTALVEQMANNFSKEPLVMEDAKFIDRRNGRWMTPHEMMLKYC